MFSQVSVCPWGDYTPPGVIPPGTVPPGPYPPPTRVAGSHHTYGRQAGGTHPTGMHPSSTSYLAHARSNILFPFPFLGPEGDILILFAAAVGGVFVIVLTTVFVCYFMQ